MSDIVLEGKREAVAQGYALWVSSITGKAPTIRRIENGRSLVLTNSQIKTMSEDIYKSLKAKPKPDDLNVSMPWGSILTPALLKAYGPYLMGIAILLIGGGYMAGLRKKSRKFRSK